MTSIDSIRRAIRERRHLAFSYANRRRVVEPMAVGRSGKGTWQLRAQQVDGLSASGRVGDGSPKQFDVAKMTDVEVLATGFVVPQQYRRGDSALVYIDTEL